MNVLILGAGNIGGKTVEDLVKSGVKEILIADIDESKADKIAEKYGGKDTHVNARYIDANNYIELVRLMDGADVVASTIGPFKRFGIQVLEAAIEANVDFIDICDDPEPTVGELDLYEKAKDAGITAIIGLGNNPGIGNLCAKYGASKLSDVEEIKFIWLHPAFEDGGEASVEHAVNAFSGKLLTYRNGDWVVVQAGSEREEAVFPDPIGKVNVVNTGHPEPITIPRYIEGVKNVSCKGSIYPQWAAEEFMRFLSYGLGSRDPIKIDGVSIEPRKFFIAFIRRLAGKIAISGGEAVKASRVILKGRRGEEKITLMYDRVGIEWNASVPLSIGIQLLGERIVKAKGVYPPEGCIDPKLFFDELRERGLRIIERKVVEAEI